MSDVLERLGASANRCTELDEAKAAERERRDGLICEARDEGHTWPVIAERARLKTTRCVTVYADR